MRDWQYELAFIKYVCLNIWKYTKRYLADIYFLFLLYFFIYLTFMYLFLYLNKRRVQITRISTQSAIKTIKKKNLFIAQDNSRIFNASLRKINCYELYVYILRIYASLNNCNQKTQETLVCHFQFLIYLN